MQKLSLFSALILLSATAFGQDGLFVKAGGGIGWASSSFTVQPRISIKSNHMSTVSNQGQLLVGRNYGNLQLETGISYFETGVEFRRTAGGGGCVVGPNPNGTPVPTSDNAIYTIRNPHIAVPLMASYTFKSKSRLSVSPGVGVEGLYNFKGKMTTNNQSDASAAVIDYAYNSFGAALLAKLDLQYRICEHLGLWVSPSYQNMISSLTTKVPGDSMSRIYDRAFLFNTGIRYTLHCCKKTPAAINDARNK